MRGTSTRVYLEGTNKDLESSCALEPETVPLILPVGCMFQEVGGGGCKKHEKHEKHAGEMCSRCSKNSRSIHWKRQVLCYALCLHCVSPDASISCRRDICCETSGRII